MKKFVARAVWTPMDYVAAFMAIAVVFLSLWTSVTAPTLTVTKMQLVLHEDKGGIQKLLVDAAIYVPTTFSGAYQADIIDANTGTVIKGCKGGADHTYRAGNTYEGPKTLDWWLFPLNHSCSLKKGQAIIVKTTYSLPGYFWGLFGDRHVHAQTGPSIVPQATKFGGVSKASYLRVSG